MSADDSSNKWILRTRNDASRPPFVTTGRYSSREEALGKAYDIYSRPAVQLTALSLVGPGAEPMNEADIAEWCNNRWMELHPSKSGDD